MVTASWHTSALHALHRLVHDCTSTASQRVAQEASAANAGLVALDAPVSGGVKKAELGNLTFMVGGHEHFELQAFLSAMGENIVHCGGNGMGQVAKICNNMAMAINMAGAAEAYNLAISLGLDPGTFHR